MGAHGGAPLCFSQPQLFRLALLDPAAQRLREHRRQRLCVNLEADAGVGPGGGTVGYRLAFGEFAVGFDLHDGGTGGEQAGFDGSAVGGHIVGPATLSIVELAGCCSVDQ